MMMKIVNIIVFRFIGVLFNDFLDEYLFFCNELFFFFKEYWVCRMVYYVYIVFYFMFICKMGVVNDVIVVVDL